MTPPSRSSQLEQAIQLHQLGQWKLAEQLYRRLLDSNPEHAVAHHLLGVLAIQNGCFAEGTESIERAIALEPNVADFHCNRGVALERTGRREEAEVAYRQALSIRPNYPEALNNLAVILIANGKPDVAINYLHRALELRPEYADAACNLGDAFHKSGDSTKAIGYYQASIAIAPRHFQAHNNLGVALMEQGNYADALAAYRQALEVQPDFASACNNLGNVYLKLENLDEAINAYRRAIELGPDILSAQMNLGVALSMVGDEENAKQIMRGLLSKNPNHSEALILLIDLCMRTCEWKGLDELCQRIRALNESEDEFATSSVISPFSFLAIPTPTTAQEQWRCAKRWGSVVGKRRDLNTSGPTYKKHFEPRSTLRIGYLSADFRSHVVGYLFPEFLEAHDRSRFQVFGYSIGVNDNSSIRQRIANACDCFCDANGLSHQAVAERIADDQIDILVDLQGYTQLSRPLILAHRPAPIQVNYLGYPGTMGVDFMDYILVDEYVVPSSQQPYFSERLVQLPGWYIVGDSQRHRELPELTRSRLGLPDDAFIFCAFSTTYKLTRDIFTIWMRLLRRIPESILWLRDDREQTTQTLQRFAEEQGVDPKRLFFAPAVPFPDHLARQKLSDLFLDTFPYNQHSSAGDTLRVGLPLLTLSGDTFPSRVAGSLLHALDLPELIATTFEEYESKAMELADRPNVLSKIRQKLATQLAYTDLFDGKIFVRRLEREYEKMWTDYEAFR